MPSTISEVEVSVQRGLEALRNLPFNEEIALSMSYIVPKGYRPVVQLEEEGRKKRSTASADSWNPATGEIVIYFEPIPMISPQQVEPLGKQKIDTVQPAPTQRSGIESESVRSHLSDTNEDLQSPPNVPTEIEIIQCCKALADAEKAGKLFIALKWFRDDFLATLNVNWAKFPETRHAVLTAAIESGKVLTKKIPNPKATQFPTTTVRLNPDADIPGLIPRFRPVPVRGEKASNTLLRDRGGN